ncbi:HAMP domain-containing sensor histidine kinase, partial [Allosphingosinicella sp.]|uniref:HAMP domain-containing sensor histidine kinase n=1 Tax=Allosphingosinicella sp. TaxID=2823234 RepID=UPI002EFBF3E4
LAEQPAPVRTGPADPRAVRTAAALRQIVADTSRVTLAASRVLDRNGIVVLGREDLGLGHGKLPEVRRALRGERSTVLRRRGDYAPRYPLEFLSRASAIRVHYALPIESGGEVIGVLMLSRSPRGLFLGIYQDRGKIALGVVGIFLILLFLAGLLSRGISQPIAALSEATENVARGPVLVPEAPATAAIEIRALYENFAAMAERIERRSRYLRDFAAAVSHEFKTPIAGIRGALELLADHGATMSEEDRRRFIRNATADADRLSHLLQRLLAQARADMTVPSEDALTLLDEPVKRVADAHRSAEFSIEVTIPAGLPPAAAPAELVEAVLETMIENSRNAGASAVSIEVRIGGAQMIVSVRDDGAGVPSGDHERIFDPFHTSRRSEGGSGLGLSIARSLLASAGGSIASLPGEAGAHFELCLPVAASVGQ